MVLKLTSIITAFIFGIAASSAQGIGLAEAPNALENAPWNNRLLVVCTDDDGQNDPPILTAQYDELFADLPGYIERDLILVWLTDSDVLTWRPVWGANDRVTLLIGGEGGDVDALRTKTDCAKNSRGVSLIGKDTGVKQQWAKAVENRALFEAIDAMPMRQSEVQRAGD